MQEPMQQVMKWSKKHWTLTRAQATIGALILVVVGYAGGVTSKNFVPFVAQAAVHDSRAPDNVDLAPLFTAWHLLDDNFAPATTTATTSAQQKLYGAIQGLAAAYGDDYTVFFPPVQKKVFDTQVKGDFEGVGMEIGSKDGVITVVSPIKDTPAARAGIEAGDRILSIDGVTTQNLAVDAAVNKIRGPKGSTVTFSISRAAKDDGKPFEVKVQRDVINLPTVDTKLRPDGVFVLSLYVFNSTSPQLFAKALDEFRASGSDKLIIDVRGNPGGYLEAAVDIASWFLPSGDVIVIQDYGKKQPEEVHRSSGYGGVTAGTKVAILINGGSASASEIFAGALHDHNRATLIGDKSFGKGSVQQLFDVTSDTSLKITIARWLTPNRVSISHQGIEPDIKVERTEADAKAGRDPQLDRAASFLLTGK